MPDRIKKFLDSGALFIWFCGTAVAASLLMVGGVLLLIMINGLGFFWPHAVVEMTLTDGTRVLGELKGEEVIPYSQTPEFPEGKTRVRLKVGNRDLYGLDFRWVDTDRIAKADSPNDVAAFERREWGNFYGRIREVSRGDDVVATGNQEGWKALQPLIEQANDLHGEIEHLQRDVIGDINYDIEETRLRIREIELHGQGQTPEVAELQAATKQLETQYQKHVETLRMLTHRLDEYSVVPRRDERQ